MEAAQYQASTVWSLLDEIRGRLTGVTVDTAEERQAVRRIEALLNLAEEYREADATLVEPQRLAEVQNAFQQIRNGVDNFLGPKQRQAAHLVNASEGPVVTAATTLRAHFTSPEPDPLTRGMKNTLTRFNNAAEAELNSLRENIANAREDANNLHVAADEHVTRLVEKASEYENFITSERDRFAALTEQVQAALQSQREAFEEELARRQHLAAEREDARDTKHNNLLEKLTADAEAGRGQDSTKAAEVLKKLRDHEAQAAKILGSTSRHAQAGEYGKWAEHQGRSALYWTIAAVVIGLGVVAGLMRAMESVADDSVQFVIYKVSIGLLAATVAGYAAKQAAEHRTQERRYKRLALDVATVEPFLATLDDPGTIRSDFAKRVFAPEEDEETRMADRDAGARFSVKEIVELLKAARA